MILYTNKSSVKKVFLPESKMLFLKNYLNENEESEGGVYHINDIDGKKMYADYEYLPDDDKIYADYSNYAKKNGLLHRANKTWFTDTHALTPYNTSGNYGKGGKRLRDSTPYSEYITDYGKVYMPVKREIGRGGDRVKEIGELKPDKVPVKNGAYIECYNLSMLGIDPSVATMIAHTYKGKDATYNGESDTPSTYSHKLVVMDKYGNKPNLIKGAYAQKIKKLILNTDGLKPSDFYPTYIIYPESSSPFNDYIAEFLIREIYPNAELIPNKTLVKTDFWDIDYDSLVSGTANEVYSTKNAAYRDYYGKYERLGNLYMMRTLFDRLKNIIANKILKAIPEFRKQFFEQEGNKNNVQEFNVMSDMSFEERCFICDEILYFILTEADKIDESLKKNGINIRISKTPYIEDLTLFVYNSIFSRNGRKNSIAYYSNNFNSAGGKRRRKYNYSSYKTLENAFKKGFLNLNMKNLMAFLASNDSIKNYDYVSRMSLFNQFKISDNYDLRKFKANASFLIIDDNFASGASIRNAAIVINEVLGIPYEKIKALTPGDMGGASSGGAQGAEVPTNDAEGYLSQLYHNGVFNNDEIDERTKERLAQKYEQLSGNQSHKKNFDLRNLHLRALNKKQRSELGLGDDRNIPYTQRTIEDPNQTRKFSKKRQTKR